MVQKSNQVKQTINNWIGDQIANVHTAISAVVVSYNPKTNRASVQPTGKWKAKDGRSIDYPVIHQVPIMFPMGSGGTAGMTFPIQSGDGCLLVFMETQCDDFLSGGDSDDPRRHSLNDAICIPGLYTGAASANVTNSGETCLFCEGSLLRLSGGSFTGTLADGTNFSFSGGDLVVNGISLTKHVHGGVESGGSKTNKPE